MPLPIAGEIVPAPEDDEEADGEPALPSPVAIPANAALDEETAAEPDAERWAGTMSTGWQSAQAKPDENALPKPPAKPRITLDEAANRIPQEALQYIRDKLKSSIHQIRAYDPANTVKR